MRKTTLSDMMAADDALAAEVLRERLDRVEALALEHEDNLTMLAARNANHKTYVDKILSQIPAARWAMRKL
jgi:two-component sensor histidine kinase